MFARQSLDLSPVHFSDIVYSYSGDSTLHPARIVSGVPTWLKTFRGNEFRRLVRKEKMFDRGTYPLYRPTKWSKMKTRMDWLWYELNYRRRIR